MFLKVDEQKIPYPGKIRCNGRFFRKGVFVNTTLISYGRFYIYQGQYLTKFSPILTCGEMCSFTANMC